MSIYFAVQHRWSLLYLYLLTFAGPAHVEG